MNSGNCRETAWSWKWRTFFEAGFLFAAKAARINAMNFQLLKTFLPRSRYMKFHMLTFLISLSVTKQQSQLSNVMTTPVEKSRSSLQKLIIASSFTRFLLSLFCLLGLVLGMLQVFSWHGFIKGFLRKVWVLKLILWSPTIPWKTLNLMTLMRAKQLSMAAIALAIWLCACVKYKPYRIVR